MTLRSATILLATLAALAGAATAAAATPALGGAALDAGARILVVAPHPDDESLCCGGLIATARRAGAEVSIVWITSGGGFRLDAMVVQKKARPKHADMRALARRRIDEAQNAAEVLDVAPEDRFFLGYPDRGLLALLLDHYQSPYRSKYTGASAVPWDVAVNPGSPYDGANLERDFARIVERVRPTLVLAPSPYDAHTDHRATGILVLRVLGTRGELDRARFWIVHGGRGWPRPRALRPDLPQSPPPRGRTLPWDVFAVDAAARESKRLALREHETQLKVMGRKMMSYVRSTELYSPLPVAATDQRCIEALPCAPEVLPQDEASL
ncbi:MAG: 1D-myo-inositol 2-acetamido-2-deoxy-alpha-D-glucopyranoside deacetylase [Steroidobacteraceae bacterium]|nr:1D-myo-inositol 2-acetamido-2-deoxy-alpha-D-glucopyranoside deacetylase [Steroidobacteraceae bacterium]